MRAWLERVSGLYVCMVDMHVLTQASYLSLQTDGSLQELAYSTNAPAAEYYVHTSANWANITTVQVNDPSVPALAGYAVVQLALGSLDTEVNHAVMLLYWHVVRCCHVTRYCCLHVQTRAGAYTAGFCALGPFASSSNCTCTINMASACMSFCTVPYLHAEPSLALTSMPHCAYMHAEPSCQPQHACLPWQPLQLQTRHRHVG